MPEHEAHAVPEVLEQYLHGGIGLAARGTLEIPVLDDGIVRRRRAGEVIGVIDRDGERKRFGWHRGFPSGRCRDDIVFVDAPPTEQIYPERGAIRVGDYLDGRPQSPADA